ncbi:MAG: penicillin-binding protein family, partial [Candidatus Solibacter sp.]|nr:penicillin-binding protein family [Candidatus Solibacter sp.]
MRELEVVAKTQEKNQKMKLRIPRGSGLTRLMLGPTGRIFLILFSLFTIIGLGVFTFFYAKYAHVIDEKLRAGVFANSAKIFAAPQAVSVGDVTSPVEIAAELRRSGYTESRSNPVGYYQLRPSSIDIFPQADSYFDQDPAILRFAGGKISQIVSLGDNTARSQYQLEPQLIQAISSSREKRRMVKFHDIPKVLVEAVTSIEDKRFFQHAGFDPIRIIKAAYVDIKEGRKDQGASTLSMQTARMFFLTQDKRWTRKLAEVIITLQLEQKLSKEDIFEYYANQVDLGWRGTFHIVGFGQASEAYLGKELNSITLPEAAEIAGMIQRPAYFDPFRHPERLKDRRNIVLQLMRQNGEISDRDYALAIDAPLTVTKTGSTSVDAPYFVDMVN